MKLAPVLALLFLPAFALAASTSTELTLSQTATVNGTRVPVTAAVSAKNSEDFQLSETKTAGAVPVTITFYVSPKPPPPPPPASQPAAVESSQPIQQGIASFSPTAASTVAPFFVMVDGGRNATADALDNQIVQTKTRLGPSAGNVGDVLSAQQTKNAASDPMGTFWYILQTLYLYLLTLLRFIVGSAAVFYPLIAIIFLYVLWRIVRRFRRPAY